MLKLIFVSGLFFLLMIFVFGFTVVRMFLRVLFGTGKSQPQARPKQNSRQQQSRQQPNEPTNHQKKIFAKDEGEYVDYEDVT